MHKFTINKNEYRIRRWQQSDSVTELTDLLHRSYKVLADMGLHFLATDQDDEMTKRRLENGESFVIEKNGKIIATVSLYNSIKSKCEWYNNAAVSYFGQFAVEPAYQNLGIGSEMMNFIESYSKEKGAEELSLDTAEGAKHLIDYYNKRGYRFIQFHQWNRANYRSVIMSKKL